MGKGGWDLKTCFVVKAANIDETKALAVAKILFPDYIDIKVDSIVNDEKTLSYEDYETLRMMVNDHLVNRIKSRRIPYDQLNHPLDVKYKKLLEKMNARLDQFPTHFT
jgi:hypothetical protein